MTISVGAQPTAIAYSHLLSDELHEHSAYLAQRQLVGWSVQFVEMHTPMLVSQRQSGVNAPQADAFGPAFAHGE
jgi:hypothetical protein